MGRSMIEIRDIRQEDAAHWRRMWKAYLAFYATERPDDVYRTSFDQLIDPKVTDYNGLIAYAGTRAIGLAHYIYHKHGWQIADVCYLQDLYVEPDVRGTGTGRKLVEAVYAEADAAGHPDVYWLTQHHNTQARHLYDRIATLTPFVKYAR